MALTQSISIPRERSLVMDEEKARQLAEDELGDKYRNFQLIGRGAQAYVFKAEWGPGKWLRAVRVEKSEPSTERARHLREKGCGAEKLIRTIGALPKPEEHNIVGLLDYRTSGDEDISVHPFIPGETLEEIIRGGPLNPQTIKRIFDGVLNAESYGIQNGVLHRDPNPANIIVHSETGEGWLIDYANAKIVGDRPSLSFPTASFAGKGVIMDPLLIPKLSGVHKKYEQDSEAYALGIGLALASSGGESPIYLDSSKLSLRDGLTGELLQTPTGKIDSEKYNQAIARFIGRLPTENRKAFGNMIQKSLSLEERSASPIEDFQKELAGVCKPPMYKRRGFIISAAAALAGVSLFGTGVAVHSNSKSLEKKLTDAEKYQVYSQWDGASLEISNNLFTFDTYSTNEIKLRSRGRILFTNPGAEIWIDYRGSQLPSPKKGMTLPWMGGRVYLEGYSENIGASKEIVFSFFPMPLDGTRAYDEYGASFPSSKVIIPKNLREGVYTLTAEVYAPTNGSEYEKKLIDRLKFTKQDTVLSRKRTTLIVGNPKNKVCLNYIKLIGYDNYLSMQEISKTETLSGAEPRADMDYVISLPEENFSDRLERRSGGAFSLPNGRDTSVRVLQIFTLDKPTSRVIGYTALPVQRYVVGDSYWWGWGIPGREFADKLPQYRRETIKKLGLVE